MLWKTPNVTDVVVVLKVPPLTFYPYSSTQHAPKEHNMASVATLHCIDSTQVYVGRNTAHISASHLIYTNLTSPSYYYQTCSPSPSCYFPNRSPTLDSLSHLIVLEHKQASSSLYKRVYIHRGSHKWTADVCVSAARWYLSEFISTAASGCVSTERWWGWLSWQLQMPDPTCPSHTLPCKFLSPPRTSQLPTALSEQAEEPRQKDWQPHLPWVKFSFLGKHNTVPTLLSKPAAHRIKQQILTSDKMLEKSKHSPATKHCQVKLKSVTLC